MFPVSEIPFPLITLNFSLVILQNALEKCPKSLDTFHDIFLSEGVFNYNSLYSSKRLFQIAQKFQQRTK